MKEISEYLEVKAKFAKYKKLEAALRIELLDKFFPDANNEICKKESGQYSIKGSFKNSIKLTSDFKDYEDIMSEEELACIERKPSLSVSKYKKLEDFERTILDNCIIVKPSMPTLEIKDVEDL